MTNPSDERISALLDGELDEPEHRKAVDELLTHDNKRALWGRYHLIGDTLKRNLPKGMDHEFSSRVMASLESEPTVLAPRPQASWGQRAAGLAVAASVAAVAVLGVQFMYQQDGNIPAQQVAQLPTKLSPMQMQQQNVARANIQPLIRPSIQPSLRANIQTVTQNSGLASLPPNVSKHRYSRLNKYLIDHNQQASGAVMQGVIPYARIVAYPNSHHTLTQAQK